MLKARALEYQSKADYRHAEQTKRLYSHTVLGGSATVVNASLLVFVFWSTIHLSYLFTWLGSLLLLVVIRARFKRRYCRLVPTPADNRKWQRRFVGTLFLTGAVWGMSALFLCAEETIVQRAFVAFLLGGMVAGSVSIHSVYLPAFLAYSVPALLPLIVVMLSNGDKVSIVMSGIVTFFLALMVALGKRLSDLFNTQLALEYDNDELIKKLESEIEVRKEAEQSLRRLNEQIENEVKHLETDLRQAQKMEVIGRLAGGVAHDLNNILGGIVSYPDFLLEDLSEDDPLYQPLLTIRQSGIKAAEVVQDLLTLARRGVAVKNIVNLNEIVTSYLGSKEHDILRDRCSNISITTELGSTLPNVQGSEIHLQKTLMNLVMNAAEAMPSGGEITIRTLHRYIETERLGDAIVQEGEYVVLIVSDNGYGMSKSVQKHIFEPFYSQKKMGRSGSGLGMAVVWGTVKDHDGYIDLLSKEGAGTTFSIYLPTTQEATTSVDDQNIDSYHGHGESILIVDDNQAQRDLAKKLLGKLGYTVATASSGEDAVERLKRTPADLLLLDMVMDPGMDGLDTYQKILEQLPGQKAVIASGYSESNRVKEAQRLGAGAYVRKPYTLLTLAKAVRAELEGKETEG